ncbi:hypothetical protein J3Q64DRAFT_1748612 [Phycomyces blakesleeanus]|uniref:SH3 domain-containing protein n=2 Tax=Phycomyces blakesleeanus TaxID=4837 RepID=A0ABR3AX76_PHYBL
MIKSFVKFKQWTGERLGAAKATLQTDDFQCMQMETEKRLAEFEILYNVAKSTHVYLSKRKVSPEDNKIKMSALETFGQTLFRCGSERDEYSDLGAVMAKMGGAEKQISVFQTEFSDVLKDRYIAMLNGGLRLFKEYSSLKKKLESRRLDHDAKQTRVNKAKKEKLEWEHEYQAAKMKYEETRQNLINKMVEIEDYEGVHRSELRILLEAQYSYHLKSLEIIDSLRKDWPMPTDDGYANYDHTGYAKSHRSTATYLSSSDGGQESDISKGSSFSGLHDAKSQNKQPSLEGSDGEEAYNASIVPSFHSTAPQAVPDALRKVVYPFNGENDDELTLRTGDIIRVLNAVDDGWWLGEIDQRRGIFPVNYTEPTCETPPLVPSKSIDDTTSVANPFDKHIDEPPVINNVSEPSISSDSTDCTGPLTHVDVATSSPCSISKDPHILSDHTIKVANSVTTNTNDSLRRSVDISSVPNVPYNNNNNNNTNNNINNNNNHNNNNNMPEITMAPSQELSKPSSSLSDALKLSAKHKSPPPPVPSRSREFGRATNEALLATGIARS